MLSIKDCVTSLRGLFPRSDVQKRAFPSRPTVRLQLEQLEKREVPSAPGAVNPFLGYAAFLEGSLTYVVTTLPNTSSWLNSSSGYLNGTFGTQVGGLFTQQMVQGVNSYLFGLQGATLNAINLAGLSPDPIYNANAAAISVFMSDPLHYHP
jgi:hypothetical protein